MAEIPTSSRQDCDERRREFLELCGKMGAAVPPTVILLASGRNALASGGRSGPPPGLPPGPPGGSPPGRRGGPPWNNS
ncbi:hypothetical protein DRB17_07600 [Ferruginivarius sediminum]|uniref:Uncharacterized protein n=1 Tax=Ferruginivarius sediminum TaxID=2661937 RepID=A0A369TB45_9PROT|nr:hypothetical protein DRB17_07600 [Ferruginivarius sediminum]